jgi:uncharacterized membrane protein YfcA
VTTTFLVFLALGAAAGGFINGLTGTGTALFSLGFYLMILPPMTAVAMVSLLSVLAGIQGLWIVRSDIKANKSKLLRFLIPGLLGVPLGILLLDSINAQTLRIGIGLLLIVYGGYFSFRTALPSITKATPKIDSCVGLIGGVLGGLASVSGALPVIWLSMRPWTKGQIRAVLQTFNMFVLSATTTLLFFKGAFDATAIKALVIVIPIGLIASQLGIFVFKRLSDNLFRRVLIGLSLLMGAGILLHALS